MSFQVLRIYRILGKQLTALGAEYSGCPCHRAAMLTYLDLLHPFRTEAVQPPAFLSDCSEFFRHSASPPYISRTPHSLQKVFLSGTLQPQFGQYSGGSSHGVQSTQESVSALYIASQIHLPQVWQRLKCVFPSLSHAIRSSFSGVSARIGFVVHTAPPQASQKNRYRFPSFV